jgi:two-component system sensor histidine kinase QseC
LKPLSLHARVTWLIIAVQVLVLVPLGVISYQRTVNEMNELADARLAQAARTLDVLIEHIEKLPTGGSDVVAPPDTPERLARVVSVHRRDFETEVGFQTYGKNRQPILVTSNLAGLAPPPLGYRGFDTLTFHGERWRMFTLRNQPDLLIRIGERYEVREDIARGLMVEHSLPLLLGLPLLALLVRWAVRRGMAPLDALTRLLAERTPGSRQPVGVDKSPPELVPLIDTLNQQLERLEDALEREHRFNADVAHELRTPLAATMIHLESASSAADPGEIPFALKSARSSLARLARRIEHLLAMARLEAGAASEQRVPLDLVSVTTEVIEELAPLIGEKSIALSLNHDLPTLRLLGHEVALTAMVRNLVENALRYVAPGGQVDISLTRQAGAVMLEISDDGPGIPAERRQAMFERFQRGQADHQEGYGLGLSIVRRAAELHHAEIELRDSLLGGLCVRIVLPANGD